MCTNYTSGYLLFFFILGKKEDKEEHLKAKDNMSREKLQKDEGRMHFVIASIENSQLMLQWPFLC